MCTFFFSHGVHAGGMPRVTSCTQERLVQEAVSRGMTAENQALRPRGFAFPDGPNVDFRMRV